MSFNRRSFIVALGAFLGAAPAIVRAASLMPVKSIILPARLTVEMTDLGLSIPGYDTAGTQFEAYTSCFRWNSCVGDALEMYSQTSKDLADLSGDINLFRMAEDTAFLESIAQHEGLDLDLSGITLVNRFGETIGP